MERIGLPLSIRSSKMLKRRLAEEVLTAKALFTVDRIAID
jgi:hypothetical protein